MLQHSLLVKESQKTRLNYCILAVELRPEKLSKSATNRTFMTTSFRFHIRRVESASAHTFNSAEHFLGVCSYYCRDRASAEMVLLPNQHDQSGILFSALKDQQPC